MSKNNLYVKNLGNLDDDDLWCLFNEIGETTSHEISRNSSGHSKGFGFVRFQDEMDAKIAISKLNGQLIGLEPLYVSYFQEKKERKNNLTNEDNNFGSQLNLESQFLSFVKTQSLGSKIFVKRLHEDVHDIDLNHLFAQFGSITSCYVLRGKNGRSIGSGVVNFSAKQEALNAIRKMNGSMFMTKKLCVEFFECKNEKKKESSDIRIKANSSIKSASLSDLSTESAQTSNINPRSTKDRVKNDTKNCNLRIENLDDDVDDNGLYQLFSCYGTIVSAKVMTYNNRKSKGYGFVCYKTSEEASEAFSSMNGYQLPSNKTLVITYYEQRKKM